MYLKGKIIRLRWKKNYKEAHNHVAIGKVICETSTYLAINCKTFHFKQLINGSMKGIMEGDICVRIIPLTMIEVMHELNAGVKYDVPLIQDAKGNILLDNKSQTIIARSQDFGD